MPVIKKDFVVKNNLLVTGNTTVPNSGNLVTTNEIRSISKPALDFNFTRNNFLDPRITFVRNSGASYINSAGILSYADTNKPRFDYDPITGQCKGLLMEIQSTNYIRNNTMNGAVAGYPGTWPTSWTYSTPQYGMNTQLVGVGVENGINYIDVRWYGTTTVSTYYIDLADFEALGGGGIPFTSTGSSYVESYYLKLVGGTTNNLLLNGFRGGYYTYDSNNNYVTGGNMAGAWYTPTSAPLITQRVISVMTNIQATTSTGYLRPYITTAFLNSGTYVDVTVRIGMPQFEIGTNVAGTATSVIATSGAQATRAQESANVYGQPFNSVYSAQAGTVYTEVSLPFPRIYHGANSWVGGICSLGSVYSGYISYFSLGYLYYDGSSYGSSYIASNGTNYNDALYTNGVPYTYSDNRYHRFAVAWNNTNYVATTVRDGNSITTASSYAASGNPNFGALVIGGRATGGDYTIIGWVRRFTYWPTQLTNSQLSALTAPNT